MVIYRFFPTLFLVALTFTPALTPGLFADESLTLASALDRGRLQARETTAATARQRAAEARAKQAAGYRLPQVRISEQWIRTDSPADAFALLLNQERFSFPAFVTGDPNNPDPLSTAITRLEVELPIWTGGELSTRLDQARLAAEAAGASAGRTGDQAAVAAAEAWIRLAQAREAAALLEKSRETVAAHVEIARAYAAQGMLVRSDMLRAEVELARIDDLLAEAHGNARTAESNLAFRLGEPIDTRYDLEALADPPPIAEQRDGWLASSGSRSDLAAARKLLEAGDLEAKAVQGGVWPRIGLVVRHDLVDDVLFGSRGDSTTIAALASFDLYDGGRRRAAMAAARADAEAGHADVERFSAGIELETKQAFEAATVALERRRTAAAALAAAAETVRIIEDRFRAGVVRSIDLLDAATAQREAEMRELAARADAWLTHLHLALAAGLEPETVLRSSTPQS
ncbi:MAG: TolC family protein [Thermoanaerobaculia bacterium]